MNQEVASDALNGYTRFKIGQFLEHLHFEVSQFTQFIHFNRNYAMGYRLLLIISRYHAGVTTQVLMFDTRETAEVMFERLTKDFTGGQDLYSKTKYCDVTVTKLY